MQDLIKRYKSLRTERQLARTYKGSYAFVGMGQHSLTNLYPVLDYLGVPLKYICVTSDKKAGLIAGRRPTVKATTSLEEILGDEEVRGVFVSAAPQAHFALASKVLKSGKSLFIEKPPCATLAELDELIALQKGRIDQCSMAGLQKRYAPAVQILRKRLCRHKPVNYELHYLTGAYPEGDALLDLFIHPLDLVTFMFGKPDIVACRRVDSQSFLLMLQHPQTAGTLELSTSYSWTAAEEQLKVCTASGVYRLSQMETLTFEPASPTVFGIPSEKIHPAGRTVEYLFDRNNFNPTLVNNQVHSQGYFNELAAFVDAVESLDGTSAPGLETIRNTYVLIDEIARLSHDS